MDNINQIWPKWHTVELLGRGAFGDVYKAKREELGEVFYSAVKVIRIPREEQEIREMLNEGHTSQSIQDYYESIARGLMNEIKVMETLKSAANVVNIEEFEVREQEKGIGWEAYIRMELLKNLNEYRAGRQLSVNETVKLGKDICQALICCEQNQIVHRDIKPSNIFVDAYGQYKLGDFGIARQLEKTQSTLSQKGTEAYMAPEVRRGERGSYNVDIYSLGLVMYRLLNRNKMPFEPMDRELCTYQEREEALEKRLRGAKIPYPAEADPILGEIVCRACAYDKRERYQSASQMKDALESWERGQETNGKSEKTSREENGGRKNSWEAKGKGEDLRGKRKAGEKSPESSEKHGFEAFDDEKTVGAFGSRNHNTGTEEKIHKEKSAKEKKEDAEKQRGKDQYLTRKIKPDQKFFFVTLNDGKRVRINVPANARDGMKVRLEGKGGQGKNGGIPGDLFIILKLESDSFAGEKSDTAFGSHWNGGKENGQGASKEQTSGTESAKKTKSAPGSMKSKEKNSKKKSSGKVNSQNGKYPDPDPPFWIIMIGPIAMVAAGISGGSLYEMALAFPTIIGRIFLDKGYAIGKYICTIGNFLIVVIGMLICFRLGFFNGVIIAAGSIMALILPIVTWKQTSQYMKNNYGR